jgi:hypothetical protein
METVEERGARDEVRKMERERLDAFARVVALSLRCNKVRFLYFPPPPHHPRQPPRTHEDDWVRAYPAGRAHTSAHAKPVARTC